GDKYLDLVAQGGQLLLRLREGFGGAADEDEVGAGLGERLGGGPAQSAAAAGDEGAFAVEVKHVEDAHHNNLRGRAEVVVGRRVGRVFEAHRDGTLRARAMGDGRLGEGRVRS